MKKILIIENDEILLETLKEVLEMNNYQVETANTGVKGIEIVKAFDPDLVICDLHLSDISGYEVFERVNIKFLFLTASHPKEWDAPVSHHHLQKPVTVHFLTEEIERILQLINEN